jgi:hypothetical protein
LSRRGGPGGMVSTRSGTGISEGMGRGKGPARRDDPER